MVSRSLMLVVAVSAVLLAGCGSDKETASSGSVAESAAEQLRYLDPQSSSVVAVDLRWDGDNWDDVRPLIGRLLKAYREQLPLLERKAIPETAQNGIEQLAGFANLSFKDDIEPALDGHLVVGAVPPARADDSFEPSEEFRTEPDLGFTAVYRTEKGDVRRLVKAVAGGAKPKTVPGHPDVADYDGVAVVGTKTIVVAAGDGGLKAALDRAKDGGGYPAEKLAEAERDTGMEDPLVLASGDLTVARQVLGEASLERAREAVPYLRALRRGSAAVDVTGDEIQGKARLVTDREPLTERDLPVAPAGELELPDLDDAVGGGSRNQSYTTTFGARLMRELFPDSRFVKAVERAEKELGIQFEDEVLRQFDCPSVSILQPAADASDPERFGARSCVNDPKRMRELLPKLRPFLPEILNGLEGLGGEGLTALLLLAPDAPLVPGGPIAQIQVTPSGEGAPDDALYEISGLRDDVDPSGQVGPDKLVFGLIGDAFVVASDAEMARRAAEVKTKKLDREAGSALRVPIRELLQRSDDGSPESKAAAAVFGDLVGTISATPEATVAEGTVELKD